ncbi:MAG: DNA topoisomerase IV subunit A [Candidatus Helarchaeota archaeon]
MEEEESTIPKLPPDVVKVDDLRREDTLERLYDVADKIYREILTSGSPTFEIPSRSSKNIIYNEEHDLLLLGEQITQRPFHHLGSVMDATRLIRILRDTNEILVKNKHTTKREMYYMAAGLYQDQKNSDKSIEDMAAMLRCIRNSTHVIASAKGMCIGRLKIRNAGDVIDLQKLGTGGWSITPMLDTIEIVESDAEFILVVEKDAALIRLSEEKWWNDYPCIILTGKGSADIATRMFLRKLSKELTLPVFCLVDSDPYGHYIYSVYLRGSKRLSYESPFVATPKMHLIGVLSRDLETYRIPKECRLDMSDSDLDRCDQMLEEPFVKQNPRWVEDLQLMKSLKKKAEIQALSSHGIEFLTETYLPTKLATGDWI